MKLERRNVTVMRRYVFRLYPTAAQAAQLHDQRMMMIDLWNGLLEMCERRYQRAVQRIHGGTSFHCAECARLSAGSKIKLCSEHKLPSEFDMGYFITDMCREMPEWRALSTWSPRRVATSLSEAFQAFFRRARQGAGAQAGYPRYRRRRDGSRIPHLHALPPGQKSGSGSGCRLQHNPARRDNSERNECTRNFLLAVKGVAGPIHARGRYPDGTNDKREKNADIIWRDGRWWFSICIETSPRRSPGGRTIVVDFDLIDGLARVSRDGVAEIDTPSKLITAMDIEEHIDRLKSERDRRWPRPARADLDWQDAQREISRSAAHAARLRRECLHVWTTRIVRDAARLVIRMPRLSDEIATPHGDEKHWGANTEAVSRLNRHALSFAPSLAAAMLKYKAEEAGISCDLIVDDKPPIAIGKELVAAGKMLRRARRKQEKANDTSRNRGRAGNDRHDDAAPH